MKDAELDRRLNEPHLKVKIDELRLSLNDRDNHVAFDEKRFPADAEVVLVEREVGTWHYWAHIFSKEYTETTEEDWNKIATRDVWEQIKGHYDHGAKA